MNNDQFGNSFNDMPLGGPKERNRAVERRSGKLASEFVEELMEGHEPLTERETAAPRPSEVMAAASNLLAPRRVHEQEARLRRQVRLEEAYRQEQEQLQRKQRQETDGLGLPNWNGITDEDHERLMAEVEQEELVERAQAMEFEDEGSAY